MEKRREPSFRDLHLSRIGTLREILGISYYHTQLQEQSPSQEANLYTIGLKRIKAEHRIFLMLAHEQDSDMPMIVERGFSIKNRPQYIG